MTQPDPAENAAKPATGPRGGPGGGRPGADGPRYFVTYTFYRIQNKFRRLDANSRLTASHDFRQHLDDWSKKIQVHAYSTAGMRPDVDFLLWRIAPDLESLHDMALATKKTAFGVHLTIPHSYLAMTRRSVYVDKHQHEGQEGSRLYIRPTESKYLFVYPFVKTHDWYQLPMADRQKAMDEHIAMGHKYPSVRINTTYCFGLDDPEFVVAFESDQPGDFLDLVMEMRSSRARPYTLRDTPIFTCIRKSFQELCEEF